MTLDPSELGFIFVISVFEELDNMIAYSFSHAAHSDTSIINARL